MISGIRNSIVNLPSRALIRAVNDGYTNLIKCLYYVGVDLNQQKNINPQKPLHLAINNRNLDIVELLLSYQVNSEALYFKKTPLHQIVHELVSEQDLNIVKALVTHGANTEALYKGKTALNHLIVEDIPEKIALRAAQILIDQGANLEAEYNEVRPLHHAICMGKYKIASLLINSGADINALGDDMTPLEWLISQVEEQVYQENQSKQLNLMMTLLKAGANPGELLSPLQCAIFLNEFENIAELIDDDKEEENRLFNNMSPLQLAMFLRHTRVVKALLAANVDKEALFGTIPPIHYAITLGCPDLMQLFIDAGANLEILYEGYPPLQYALERNETDIAKSLIKAQANRGDFTDLHWAIFKGKSKTVNVLLEQGVETESLFHGMTALFYAMYESQFSIADNLIHFGANKNALYNGLSPIHYTIKFDDKQLLKQVLSWGGDKEILYKGMTPLHYAIKRKGTKAIRLLIKAGVNTQALYDGKTPLEHAISIKALKIAAIFYHDPENHHGIKPLHWNIVNGKFKAVAQDIANGADIEAQSLGKTALELALEYQEENIATLLIQSGANINIVHQGRSLLHHAITLRSIAMVNALIARGVDLEQKNSSSMTPLARAIKKYQFKIARNLLKAGAKKNLSYELLRQCSDEPKLVNALFEHCTVFELPITSIINSSTALNSTEAKIRFLRTSDPIRYLKKHKISSPLTLTALQIIDNTNRVKNYEDDLQNGDENAMNAAKVVRANYQFTNKVQPHFKEQLLSYSTTHDETQAIEKIEREIRKILLNDILKNAQESQNQSVVSFISENEAKLLDAEDNALKQSCQIFTNDTDLAQAAWRGFNPHAPVKDEKEWPNLLTPPVSDEKVWTIEVDAQEQERDPAQVYDILRQRVINYFLAAIDLQDGDDKTRETRITNFINQLADIRNAHGFNNPSCYPGHITRIASMGAFHSIAQLPPTTKELISDYIKEKALALFQEKFEQLETMEEKEALYESLTMVSADTARSVILNPVQYNELVELRQEFVAQLGTAQEIFDYIVSYELFPIVEEEICYIELFLADIAGGMRGAALADYYNKQTDSIPTSEDLQIINPFSVQNEQAYELAELLQNILLEIVPIYTTSLRQLKNLSRHLEKKVPVILKGEPLIITIEPLDIEENSKAKVLAAAESAIKARGWVFQAEIVNPYDSKIVGIKRLIEILHQQEKDVSQLQKNLEFTQQKQNIFTNYLPLVKTAFEGSNIQSDRLTRITEALVHQHNNDQIDLNQLKQVEILDDSDIQFVSQHQEKFQNIKIRA